MQNPTSIKLYAYLNAAWVELDDVAPIEVQYGMPDNLPTTRLADVGEMIFNLNNSTGQYSTNHPSALSGWNRGVTVKLEIVYIRTHTKFIGIVADIETVSRQKQVKVTVLDWFDVAAKYPIVNPELLQNVGADDAVTEILSAMPITPTATSLSAGAFEFPTVFDTVSGYTKAYTEFAKLAASELGYVYRTANDTLVLENLEARNGARTLQTYHATNTGFLLKADGGFLLKADGGKLIYSDDIVYDAIFDNVATDKETKFGDNIINRFVANAYPKRTDEDPVLIHESESEIRLNGGERKSFRIFWRDPQGKRPINALPPDGSSTTKALCHFEDRTGDSYDANFIDETGKAWVPIDVTQVSSPARFGRYGAYMDGSTSFLYSAHSVDWELTTQNFCIEWWEYRYNTSTSASIVRDGSTGYQAFILGRSNGTNLLIDMSSNGSTWDIANSRSLGAITTNTWNHFAITRSGTTFRAFKNGALTDTWTSSASLYAVTSPLYVGKYGGTYITAVIDELRITKGDAVYTAAFTPSEQEFSINGSIYSFWSGQGSTGTDLTPYLTVTATYGTEGATFTVENTGSTSGYLKIKVYGYGIYSDSPLEYSEEDSASILQFGYQPSGLQQQYQQDIYAGEFESRRVVEINKTSRVVLNTFTSCANISNSNLSAFLNIDVGDLVKIIIDEDNINSWYYVQGVKFTIRGKIIFFTWTVTQAWTLTDGYTLMAMEGDGTGDALDYGYNPVATPSNRGISAWIYLDTISATLDRVILSNGDGFSLYVDNHATDRYLFFKRDFSTTDGIWRIPVNSFSLATWTHVFVAYNDGATTNDPVIYINGVSQTITETSTPAGTAVSELGFHIVLGNYPAGGGAWDGKLKDVRIYNLATSTHAASALASGIYAEGAGGNDYYSGMKFIAPVVRDEDLTDYTNLTLSTEKVLEGYLGAVGSPSGNPIMRTI